MGQNAEILLEGTYLYYQKEVNYSQENFKLLHMTDTQSYHVYAEILSRIETGEFLKILVRYEMNQYFTPVLVRIEKSIGSKYVQEVFKIDPQTQEMKYTFQTPQNTQEYSRTINAKHYLTSPAVSTSAFFTQSKKFDASGRTPVVFVSSDNEWTYEKPPVERVVYAEFKARDLSDFMLNGNALSASHLCLFENDASHGRQESPVELFLSKHYSVPYQLTQDDLRITIRNLKKNG